MDKVKQERVIIYCKELLTGEELIQVIRQYGIENMLIEKISVQTTFDEPEFDRRIGTQVRKPNGIEYCYIFVNKNGGINNDK